MNTDTTNRFRSQPVGKSDCAFSLFVPSFAEACVNCEPVNIEVYLCFTITSDHMVGLVVKVDMYINAAGLDS